MSQEAQFPCWTPDGVPFTIFSEYDELEQHWYAGTHIEHRGELSAIAEWREGAIFDLVALALRPYRCGRVELGPFTDLTRRDKLERRRGAVWFKQTLDLTEGKPQS